MRFILAAVVSSVMASASAAGTMSQPIDLNRPGTLEQLKVERPKHYAAITEVLRVAARLPCGDREIRSLKARFDITQLGCHLELMTSDPPKRRLSFELEGTHYVATVTLQDTEGRSIPVRNAD